MIMMADINTSGIPLYFSKLPTQEYEEIAVIETSSGAADLKNIIQKFKEKAMEVHSDAVIRVTISRVRDSYHINGILIRFKK